jgi:hypothetical protein
MDPQDYVDLAKDPSSWFRKADDLLKDHNVLWEKGEEVMNQIAEAPPSSAKGKLSRRLASIMLSSELLLALSLENALKGHLLSEKPQEVEMRITVDGEGDFKEARLTSIAESNPDHDLSGLAHEMGVFAQKNNSLLDDPPDPERLETVLEHLTHVIRWVGRYPVPLDSEEHREWQEDVMSEEEGNTTPLFTMVENHDMAVDVARQLIPEETTEE